MHAPTEFQKLCRFFYQDSPLNEDDVSSFTLYGHQHSVCSNRKSWRCVTEANAIFFLFENLPAAMNNLALKQLLASYLPEHEIELLNYIGFRLMGKKLLQLSVLKTWTDTLSEHNKQLMMRALEAMRQAPNPAAREIKPAYLAEIPAQQALQALNEILSANRFFDSEKTSLQTIATYIEEYHAL